MTLFPDENRLTFNTVDIFAIDLTPNDIKSGQYKLKARSYYLKTRQYDPKIRKTHPKIRKNSPQTTAKKHPKRPQKKHPKRPQKTPISTCPLSISPYPLFIKTKDVG